MPVLGARVDVLADRAKTTRPGSLLGRTRAFISVVTTGDLVVAVRGEVDVVHRGVAVEEIRRGICWDLAARNSADHVVHLFATPSRGLSR